MRRRYQFGHVFERGKRRRVWVGRWVEPKLEQGAIRRVLRSRVIGPRDRLTKGQAQKIMSDWLKPLNEGNFVPVESAGFAEFYDKWERDLLPSYRESTREFYRATARRWICPYFEDWKMTEIRPGEIQRFINLFAGKYSRSVLKHVRATLRCLFNAAVAWRYVRENPCAGLRLPAGRAVERSRVLEPEEVGRVVAALGEPYRTMVVIAATTGMRPSEVLALKWDDFNPVKRTVRVRRAVYEGKVGSVKTIGSEREIPYHQGVNDALIRLARERPGDGEFLFKTVFGNHFTPEHVTEKIFKPLAATLGIRAFSWRTFRRSAETWMHNAGVPMKVQQAMLGHSNPNTTLLYAEADEKGKRYAADRLSGLVFPELSQVATGNASKLVN